MTTRPVENQANLWTFDEILAHNNKKNEEFFLDKIDEAPYLHTDMPVGKAAGQRADNPPLPGVLPCSSTRPAYHVLQACGMRLFVVGHTAHAVPPRRPDQEEQMTDQPTCPVCNQPAADVTHRTKRGIATAECVCPNEHLWSTRWLLPIVPLDPLPDQEAS